MRQEVTTVWRKLLNGDLQSPRLHFSLVSRNTTHRILIRI